MATAGKSLFDLDEDEEDSSPPEEKTAVEGRGVYSSQPYNLSSSSFLNLIFFPKFSGVFDPLNNFQLFPTAVIS